MNIFGKIKVVNKIIKVIDVIKKNGLQDKLLKIVDEVKEICPEIKQTIEEIGAELCK